MSYYVLQTLCAADVFVTIIDYLAYSSRHSDDKTDIEGELHDDSCISFCAMQETSASI